jgi:ribonuclease HI
MYFKGQKIFVLVDKNNNPVINNGRATIKYKPEDTKTYNPWASNIANSPSKTKTTESQNSNHLTSALKENRITAYTDGGCIGNPGLAGLGYIIIFPDGSRIKKGEPLGTATNNIAELSAILRVLQLIDNKSLPLDIYTDSAYAIGVLTKNWKAKANQNLILQIKSLLSLFTNVSLIKVKGHAGIPENELVDKLANSAARTQKEV